MIHPEDHINFHGRDWYTLKSWLKEVKETKIGLLIQADSHDKSNQIRGTLSFINEILALERAAEMAAKQKGQTNE